MDASFVSGINELLVITAIIAIIGAVCSVVLIRGRDFVGHRPPPDPRPRAAAPEVAPA